MSTLVLVTGITGFIAKQVAFDLLGEGFSVRGTLRNSAHADTVRQAMGVHGADVTKLSFVEADLSQDRGWLEAMDGCTYVHHIASPVPVAQPRNRESLVPLARDGALRVLNAAKSADIERVVVTSSMSAMAFDGPRTANKHISETSWSDPNWRGASAYIVSKTRAELAIWEWAEKEGWTERVTTVNPAYVFGPLLDGKVTSSGKIIQLLLEGTYPILPPIHLMIVDIRNVAELHRRAMTTPALGGRRLFAAASSLSMVDIAGILRDSFPEYASKIPLRTMPEFAMRIAAKFDRRLTSIVPEIGPPLIADNAYVTELTGVRFRSAEEAVRATGQSLIDYAAV